MTTIRVLQGAKRDRSAADRKSVARASRWIAGLQRCLLAAAALVAVPAQATEWLPISLDEAKMTSEPKALGAAAIYLYIQVDRNDGEHLVDHYVRIKILTEEGRKYGDVQLDYTKGKESIRGIEARTIRPDGSVVPFDGTIYEKPIVTRRGAKQMAKSFTLPEVQVGSIIEYRWRHNLQLGYVFDSKWILSQNLFTKHAKYSLHKYDRFAIRWSLPVGLPEGMPKPENDHGVIRLEVHDVPAFVAEELAPPAETTKYRVEFVYYTMDEDFDTAAAFWKHFDKERWREVDRFVDEKRAMERAVAQIVEPADPALTRVKKIYARVQALRNTTYERDRDEQEIKRDEEKRASDVEDVWTHGYGNAVDLTWLFLALVRTAGVPAEAVLLPTRDTHMFSEKLMNASQLNWSAVVVKVDGQDLYLEPGVPNVPFGLLPWFETGVAGLKLTKDGGEWVTTPIPPAPESRVEHKGTFTMERDGALAGKATFRFVGLEGLARRLDERGEDDVARKQFLEAEVKRLIPTGSDVTLTNAPDWESADPVLSADFDVRIPAWGQVAGKRVLLPVGVFTAGERHSFDHPVRVHPLYFDFPTESDDDVTIKLPDGWHADTLPAAHANDLKAFVYATSITEQSGTLHATRKLTIQAVVLNVKFYDTIRAFFQEVRTSDEEQAVLSPGKAPVAH